MEAADSATKAEGSGDPVHALRHLYPSPGDASEVALAKLGALTRGTGRPLITLEPGQPEVAAEVALRLSGFSRGLDSRWICMRVTHQSTQGCHSTNVQTKPSMTYNSFLQPLRRPPTAEATTKLA